jgi:succinate-semialdehyde dehydrogenase/glutarate-semialdehyde dehydrogenase
LWDSSTTSEVKLPPSRAYVAGAWVDAESGNRFEVNDPATGATLATLPSLGAGDAAQAISAASDAFPGWRRRTAAERANILRQWAASMLVAQDDLANLVTAESGKPRSEALGEVRYASDFLSWFAEEAQRTYGQVIPPHVADRRSFVLRRPIGVGAAITPWNFPLAMVTRKCGPALAVGCTVVLKPSELTPLSALALAALGEEAGLPPGAFNVLTSGAIDTSAVGETITSSPVVRALSFTGSTAVGKALLAACAPTVKRVTLELGGNAPFIVFDDADLQEAADGLIASKFRNSGQTCICANRVLVHRHVQSAFEEIVAEKVSALRVGTGFDPEADIGPLINAAAVEKVERHVHDAVERGARLVVGGARHPLGDSFYSPTLLSDVTRDALLTEEETFGPLCALIPFNDEQDAVELANATATGLAAYAYTRDTARIWRLADELETGVLGANTGAVSTAVAPLGGIKESGLGREGGSLGVDEWLEATYLALAL